MDEPYKKKTSKAVTVLCAVLCMITSAAALLGWLKYEAVMLLVVFTVVGAIVFGYLKYVYTLMELIHFGLWCLIGKFLPAPFYVAALLALDVGLILANAAVLFTLLFTAKRNRSADSKTLSSLS